MTKSEAKKQQKKLAEKLYEYHYKSLGFRYDAKEVALYN